MTIQEKNPSETPLNELIFLFNQHYLKEDKYLQRKDLSPIPSWQFSFLPETLKRFLVNNTDIVICLQPSLDEKEPGKIWYEVVLEGNQTHYLVSFCFNNRTPDDSSIWCVYPGGKVVQEETTSELNQPPQASQRLSLIRQILLMSLGGLEPPTSPPKFSTATQNRTEIYGSGNRCSIR